MGMCVFVWLAFEKERQGEILHATVVSLFKKRGSLLINNAK